MQAGGVANCFKHGMIVLLLLAFIREPIVNCEWQYQAVNIHLLIISDIFHPRKHMPRTSQAGLNFMEELRSVYIEGDLALRHYTPRICRYLHSNYR